MLVRVFPEQVAEAWDYFGGMLAQSMPVEVATSREVLTNMLAAILRDGLVVWVYKGEEGEHKYLVSTAVWRDDIACLKSLMIYNLYSISGFSVEEAKEGIKTLKEYGRGLGCSRVVGIAKNDPLYHRLLKQIGGDMSNTMAVFQI